MNIRSSDYLLVRFSRRSQILLRWLASWESRYLGEELAAIHIDRPVFVTGLARSGTTLLLELLSAVTGVATHRYRDFPFLMIPYFWNRYQDRFPAEQLRVERAHRDRIFITRESPEAMEEPLWRAFFSEIHSPTGLHRMTRAEGSSDFERFYRDHIRKLLLIRRGTRYLAKGNCHIPRLEYLADLFPDARFIIPVREPLTHVASLVRQHQLFCSYAAADPRVPHYLEAAGHFEFGPQRMPIRLNAEQGDRIVRAWSAGQDHLGYGIQWREVYGFVQTLRSDPALASRISLVRYEDLCESPEWTLRRLLGEIEFDDAAAGPLWEQLSRVAKSPHAAPPEDGLQQAILGETADVARTYGYD